LLCARIADDKKAGCTVILRMTELIVLTDYFVITSGTNPRQVQAIADEIRRSMDKLRLRCLSVEGFEEGRWVLLDYGDVVVHVFDEATRDFYDLERLWADAPRVRWRRTLRAARKQAVSTGPSATSRFDRLKAPSTSRGSGPSGSRPRAGRGGESS
jgi:ribosome-associated protein